MSTCTAIAANSDVSGIGIRVNLYITALIIAFIPTNPTDAEAARKSSGAELLEIVSTGAAISGVSLLITAVVQTAQGQLSLFHAIFVIHMLYFTSIVVVPAGHYKADSVTARLIRVVLAIVLIYGSIMLFIGYALYVWVKAPTFGSFPECNDQIKYIFFFPLRLCDHRMVEEIMDSCFSNNFCRSCHCPYCIRLPVTWSAETTDPTLRVSEPRGLVHRKIIKAIDCSLWYRNAGIIYEQKQAFDRY